jgi:hypothetical protein
MIRSPNADPQRVVVGAVPASGTNRGHRHHPVSTYWHLMAHNPLISNNTPAQKIS